MTLASPVASVAPARVVAVAALSTTLATMPVMLLGAVAVLIRTELGFDESVLGLTVAMFFLTSAAATIPGGRLAGHIGPRRSLLAGAVGSALSMVGCATAGSQGVLMAWLGIAGIANGVAQPGANLALACGVPASRQGLAFGAKHAAVPLGGMIAGLMVPSVALTVGWRWAYVSAAALTVIVWWLVPPDLIGRSTPELRRAEGGLQFPLAVIALAFVFGAAAMNSMTAFLVESSVSSGLSPARSAGLLVLGSATGWVARVLIGWRADHRGARHLIVVALLLVCGSVGLWGLSSSRPTVLVIATVVGFTGLGWSGLATYAVVRIQPDRPAGATSAVLAGAFVGAVLGPAIFGHVVARSSYGYAWAMAGAWAFVAAALMLLARRAIRRAHRSP